MKSKYERLHDEFMGLVEARELWERQCVVNYYSIFTKEKYLMRGNGDICKMSEDPKQAVYTRISKLLPIYRTLFTKITKANPLFRVEPNSMEDDDERGADLAESLFKMRFPEWKREGLLNKSACWFIVTGNAYAKAVFNKDVGDIIAVDDKGAMYKEGKAGIKALCPLNIYHSINAEINTIDDATRVYEVIILPREYAKEKFGVGDGEGCIKNSLKYKMLLTGDLMSFDKHNNFEEYAEVILMTEARNVVKKEGDFVIMTDKEIKKDLNKNPFPKGMNHPYAQAKMIENGTAQGDTSINYSTQIDRDYNLSRGQRAEHAKKFAFPPLALSMRSTLKSEEIANEKVKVIYVDPRSTFDPKYIQPTENAGYFDKNEALLEQDLMDINATHEPQQGKRPMGVKSGIALAYLGEQDDVQHAPMVDNFFAMLETAGNKYLQLEQEFHAEDELVIKLYGKDNYEYAEFQGKELKNNTTVRIVVNTGLPSNRIARQQVLMELGAARLIGPSLIRELLEFSELEPITRALMKEKTRQNKEIMLITTGKGGDVSVRAEDNPIAHIETCYVFFRSSRFKKLKKEYQKELWDHVTNHIQQMITTLYESPLLAAFSMQVWNVDPELKIYIQSEVEKSVAEKKKLEMEKAAKEGRLPADTRGGPAVNSAAQPQYPSNQPSMEEIMANAMQNKNGMPPAAAAAGAQAQQMPPG